MKLVLSSAPPLFRLSFLFLTLTLFVLILVGGLTRLTGSGLSMVEWKPITGILPPLSLQEWTFEFSQYQSSPEFQKINRLMTLDDFKSIFWLEYIHRLVARLLGIFLVIPTVFMIFRKQNRHFWPFISLLWGLGLAQGVMGWLMVKSGLVHDPYVSPYRLAVHLLLGFAIFGVALWTTLRLYHPPFPLRKTPPRFLIRGLWGIFTLLLGTAFLGALVAGHKAGLLYPTFPLMGGHLIPPEVFKTISDPASLQFFHRLFAFFTVSGCTGLWVYQRKLSLPPPLHRAFSSIALIAFLQLSLGIATVLQGVPCGLALAHQGFAFVLFGSVLYTVFLLRRQRAEKP